MDPCPTRHGPAPHTSWPGWTRTSPGTPAVVWPRDPTGRDPHGAWGLGACDFPGRWCGGGASRCMGSCRVRFSSARVGGKGNGFHTEDHAGKWPDRVEGRLPPSADDVRTLGGGWFPDPRGGTCTQVLPALVTATMRDPRPRRGVILTVHGVLRRANFREPESGVGSRTGGWLIGCVNEGTRRVGLPVPDDGAAGGAAGCRSARFSPGMGCHPW